MALVVAASNFAVQFPINDWLTWGAFTYPFSFLVTDVSNRALGPRVARRIVYRGFVLAVVLSFALATPRLAVASGAAFLVGQLLDVSVFDRLRRAAWWWAPLVSSSLASALDSFLFFALAFSGSGAPWVSWAAGDYGVKLGAAVLLLVPFRLLTKAAPQTA
jgi:uncharacterized PurR-regulated membrane protein YhhQ (DUF165 family)